MAAALFDQLTSGGRPAKMFNVDVGAEIGADADAAIRARSHMATGRAEAWVGPQRGATPYFVASPGHLMRP